MALHCGVRRPRAMGREHRPDAHGLDRWVRAVSGGGVVRHLSVARRLIMDTGTRSLRSLSRDDGLDVPRDEDGPVFREPWEAQAFALALSLHERGVFSWKEWTAVLGEEIKQAQAAGDPDTGETYYHHWLATLERMVAEKGVTSAQSLAQHYRAWERATHRTPHGKPIELKPEDFHK